MTILKKADQLYRQRDFKQAINLYKQALLLNKNYKEKLYLLNKLGWSFDQLALSQKSKESKKDLQKKAIDYFRKSLLNSNKLNDKVKALTGVGTVYLHKQKSNLAIKYYNKAESHVPNSALIGLGNAHRSSGNFIEAIRFYKKSLKRAKAEHEKFAPLYNLAVMNKQLENFKEAVKFAQLTIKTVKRMDNFCLPEEMEKILKEIIKSAK